MRKSLQFSSVELNPIHLINTLLISIILLLHHTGYTMGASILREYHLNYLLQKFAVGGFFFFSGLKLTISNFDYSPYNFYKKRLVRIYFLYLFALIISTFTSYPFSHRGALPHIGTFLLHVFCLQSIFPIKFGQGSYHTIWFVSVLFFCYMLFPLLKKDILSTKKFFLKNLTIFILIYVLYLLGNKLKFNIFFSEFPVYVMFFSFGVIGTRYNINKFHKYLYLLVGLLGSLLLLLIYNQPGTNTWYENYLFVYFLILISNLSFFCILIRTVKAIRFTGKIAKFFEIFSYSSFCIFLLHRPIWSIMAVIYPEVSTSKPLSLEPILQYLYIVFLGVPIIVLCSYLIQSNYNSLLNYLSKGHKL